MDFSFKTNGTKVKILFLNFSQSLFKITLTNLNLLTCSLLQLTDIFLLINFPLNDLDILQLEKLPQLELDFLRKNDHGLRVQDCGVIANLPALHDNLEDVQRFLEGQSLSQNLLELHLAPFENQVVEAPFGSTQFQFYQVLSFRFQT